MECTTVVAYTRLDDGLLGRVITAKTELRLIGWALRIEGLRWVAAFTGAEICVHGYYLEQVVISAKAIDAEMVCRAELERLGIDPDSFTKKG